MALSDEDLVRKCLNGEDSAYGFLVDKYKGAVHALARKKLGSYHDAEDVAQEAFLKAYQNLPSLKAPNRFAGWLYVITANECRRRLKKWSRERKGLLSMKEEIFLQEESEYASQQAKEQLRDAVETLPESDKTVIHLHYFGGLTCEEIGRFLGTSKNAVKMRLSRARVQLKKEITEMLAQEASVIQLPMQFTMRIMERVHRAPFLPPRIIRPNPFGRFIPIGTFLLSALIIIGLGLFSQRTAIPPTNWEGTREIDVPIDLLDWPIFAESLTIGGTQESGQSSENMVTPGAPKPSVAQNGNDAFGLAALAQESDEVPHISGIVVSKRTGQPIPNAVIYLGGKERDVKRTVTDASGRFWLNEDVSGKTIVVKAAGYGFRFVQFPDGQRIVNGIRIELDRGIQAIGKVVDTDGKPIADALVSLIVGLSYGRGGLIEGVHTDRNGRYVLSDLSPLLSYGISASHPKYKGARVKQAFIPVLHGTVAPTIVMEPRYIPSSAAFQEGQGLLVRGVTVWGFVRTADGEPVAEAIVGLGRAGTDRQAVIVETDSQGKYRAEDVLAGSIHLLVRAKGFSPFHEPIDTTEGKKIERNVTLTESPILEGKVIDELTGNPIPKIKVLLGPWYLLLGSWYHSKKPRQEPAILDLRIFTVTDSKGQFSYDEVPIEGTFQINVLEHGIYGGQMAQYKYAPSIQAFTDTFDNPVETPLVFKLKRKAHVRVRVIDAKTEKPITNFYVSLHRGGMFPEWQREMEQGGCYVYAEDGLFVGPPRSENSKITLSFFADGYAPGLIESAVNLVVPEVIALRLQKEKVLSGQIIDAETGEPIENAWVKSFSPLFPLQIHNGEPEAMGGISDLSDKDGAFTLHQIGAGKHSFFVKHSDYAPAIIFDKELGEGKEEPLVVRLSKGGKVAGTALPETQIALAFAEHIYGKEPTGGRPYFELILLTKTDGQGRFQFERLPPGKYYLAVNDDNHPRLEVERHERIERIYPEKIVHLIEVQEGAVTLRNLP